MTIMKQLQSWRSRRGMMAFYLSLLLLLPLLTACEDDGLFELIAEMAVEWAEEKQLIKVSDEGDVSPDWVQIGIYETTRGYNSVFGSGYTTGDEAVDAALDAAPIAKSVKDADKLAKEGMDGNDPAKLDQAIDKRPGDWNYHDQKGAILAATGNGAEAESAFDSSQNLVDKRISEGGSCRALHQNMLRGRIQALEQKAAADPDNAKLNNFLAQSRAELHALNTNQAGSPCP